MKSFWITPGVLRDLAAEETDAHRLCTAGDGWVERFGSDILISYQHEAAKERLEREFHLWSEEAALRFNRIFARYLPIRNSEREAPRLLFGDANENLRTVTTERSLRYGIDFEAGYSVGLFVDQRENRRFVRQTAPKKLLNCFSYTCSFSVAAATADAKTVNIDLSKKSLSRGKENFALNSLNTNDHQFIADDVMEVLPRLARRNERFDMIILDPPTFSRSHRGKAFQVERDFEALLAAALEVAERDARLLLSTNCTSIDARGLELMARFCLKTARRAGAFHQQPPLPDVPANAAARTLWLTLR